MIAHRGLASYLLLGHKCLNRRRVKHSSAGSAEYDRNVTVVTAAPARLRYNART